MQGEDPKDFDSMKEAVDGFYLAIGHLVHTLKGRETFICIKSHKKKILVRKRTGKQAADKDQISQMTSVYLTALWCTF